MYEDCVGPSAYWKAQGTVVRVWGLLFQGVVFLYVLPKGQVMNRWWYEWLIRSKFSEWISQLQASAAKVFLVQDHERALWSSEPRSAMRAVGISLLENYPKCSQDLNPVELIWKELRARLATTEPRARTGSRSALARAMESREHFIRRLRKAVEWLNRNREESLLDLCRCQKAWAQDVLDSKGARTKH